MAGRGHNPTHGYDEGPPPPGMMPGGTPQYPSQGYFPGPVPMANAAFQYPIQPSYPQANFQPVMPGMPGMYPQPSYDYPGMTYPSPFFAPDHGFPGIHLRNHTGGIGLPPGYDYAFPREHTKIHVFKTKQKPWQSTIWTNDTSTHVKLFVPVHTTTKELMQNLGCVNEEAKMNIMYECVEKGNGQWATGLKLNGDDKDKMKMPISHWGWDKTRTGHPGEKPVVWLWCTSEGDHHHHPHRHAGR